VSLQAPRSLTNPVNPIVTVVVGVTNQGPGLATSPNYPWLDYFLLSHQPGSGRIGHNGPGGRRNRSIPAGATYWRTNSLALPLVASGDYFLIFSANGNQAIPENPFSQTIHSLSRSRSI